MIERNAPSIVYFFIRGTLPSGCTTVTLVPEGVMDMMEEV